MQNIAISKEFIEGRYLFFKWRYNLAIIKKMFLAFGMACITGFVSQINISLPWTPVPITGQVFAALLSGVLLGRWWGGISQIIYITLGVIGIPWFAGFSNGFNILICPSGGYIIGFIFASLFMGYFTDKYIKARGFIAMIGLMSFANFVLIHVPGLLQLGLWFYLVKGTGLTLWNLLYMGTTPFILGDIIKIIMAALFAKAITPKEAYNMEKDNY